MKINFNEIARLESVNAREVALKDYIIYGRTVPALYVSTYGKYSSGYLTGAWINLQACGDPETFYNVIKAFHADEKFPEYMFQDFCGFPEELCQECGGVDNIFTYIEALKNGHDPEALAAYLQYFDVDQISDFENCFLGAFDSELDFTYYLVEEMELLKDAGTLELYFNYKAYARDIFINDYVFINGFVFRRY